MNVLVGVGGGIAAYKSVSLVRELQRSGASVRVVMTPSATRFVGPITFTGITGHPAIHDLWDPAYPGEVHVSLAGWADRMVVAPATMNMIARATQGMADDPVLASLACMTGPCFLAPAMHSAMWAAAATQRNIATLRQDGWTIIGPEEGPLASGESGLGRMSEPEDIARAVLGEAKQDLKDRRVLITAGPTREALDPVRFLSNRSTGRMGFALAEAAAARGAETTLISGPTDLQASARVNQLQVISALEMHEAVNANALTQDVVIMAAAVSDYRPAEIDSQKIKKTSGDRSLTLTRNPDILAELGASRTTGRPVLIGFALETEHLIRNAQAKLKRKGADLIVANHADVGFAGQDNQVTLVSPAGTEPLPRMTKRALADVILDRARSQLASE